jgi:hypothetical protein
MQHTAHILSFSALHASGIYSPRGVDNWKSDQLDSADIRRSQVLSRPYVAFGKLQLADKLAFATASLCLDGIEERLWDRMGIVLAIPTGSLSTDFRYQESVDSGFPSPALFSATLPSSPITDVAIYYKIKGPNRIIAGDSACGLQGLISALQMLERNRATHILYIYVNAIESADRTSPLLPQWIGKDNESFAFILSKDTGATKNMTVNLSVHPKHSGIEKRSRSDGRELFSLIQLLTERQSATIDIETEYFDGTLSLSKE